MNTTWMRGDLPSDDVTALVRDAEIHDGFKAMSDQALLEARRGGRDVLLAHDGEGTLLGVGIIGGGELDLLVAPDMRGEGLGGTMFAELLDRAPGSETKAWVHGGPHSGRDAAEHLLTRAGFQPVRTLLRLSLDGSALDGRPFHRHGLDLRTYSPQDAPEIVRVNAAAFASHPEQGKLTLEQFLDITREPWFDPEDLLLLGDEHVMAFTWVKTVRDGSRTDTELYVIGVHPDAAGQGLGTKMLEATLDRMSLHAPDRVTLYVEGDNEPALALYRRAGFTELQRSSQWSNLTAQVNER